MKENRWTLLWYPGGADEGVQLPRPRARQGAGRDAHRPQPRAALRGPATARRASAAGRATVAKRYPQVRRFIIGNEPNQPRFWRPQFVHFKPVAGAAYERLLAACYDTLKAVDPTLQVIGFGLSPRGNDKPHAKSNVSTSPMRFLAQAAAAYRASGRRTPLMDALAVHPYPNPNAAADPPTVGYPSPFNYGVPNIDRVEQAVWDGFHGTAQPTTVTVSAWSSTRPAGRRRPIASTARSTPARR